MEWGAALNGILSTLLFMFLGIRLADRESTGGVEGG
jgi:hypothetical protein